MVKHDLNCSLESWSRGEITQVIGPEGGKNLGDESGYNIKKFDIKYWRDMGAGSKIFRADSSQIAMYDTRT